jgi:DNA-binding MarR family transcriptional regulator
MISVYNARDLYRGRGDLTTTFVHSARMSDWSDEIHAVFLQLIGYMNRPDLDSAFLALADVKLDRALYPLLLRIGYAEPVSVMELAGLVGRDHSTVSRQVAKLEKLGLVERHVVADDQRIRLLKPSAAGRKMLATFSNVRRRIFEKRLGDWTPEERNLLLDLLQRFAGRIGEASEMVSPSSASALRLTSGKQAKPGPQHANCPRPRRRR